VRRVLAWILPLLALAALGAAFLAADPLARLLSPAPPVEELTVERTVLDGSGIALQVRAAGTEPLRIAQIQVDGAYWTFRQDPPGPIARLRTAWLHIPYPWILGETHHITILSAAGVPFEHTIDVALATPAMTGGMLRTFALVGLFVGLVPVALGMLFYPALRSAGGGAITFALALTVGLLGFLLVDTMDAALDEAGKAAPALEPTVVVWLVAALAFAVLMAAGRRGGGAPGGVALAWSIALGIGLHNFGEGLAIGSAFATGAAALGSFLVLGFTLHNVTEGIGIIAPLVREPPRLPLLAGLAALAGLPAVPGVWLGSAAFTSHWAALALAIGAGAILQVIVEVGLLLARRGPADGPKWATAPAMAGLLAGVLVMYGTALVVQV
jgi:hypothetical protein